MRHVFSSHERRKSLAGSGLFAAAVIAAVSMVATSHADVITFGSGANAFNMEFVTIGNPGNTADTTGNPNPAGSVAYQYDIGKHEVSEDMIDKYNAAYGTSNSLVITKDTRGTNKPATSVSWNEAARFVNWLNTSTGGTAAYKFTTNGVNDNIALWDAILDPLDYDLSNPYRSKRTKYALPSFNEWYKAAYYDPNANGGAGGYWNYATGSDSVPTAVGSGTTNGTAVYNQPLAQGPADITTAGGLSPYGVMGLDGNVYEWEESSANRTNSAATLNRGIRGTYYSETFLNSASVRYQYGPTNDVAYDLGFRVVMLPPPPTPPAAVPEPTSIAILGIGALGLVFHVRRRNKA